MRILFSWLQEYCDIQKYCDDQKCCGSQAQSEKIAALLTQAGIEVDDAQEITPNFRGVIAARLEEVKETETGHFITRVFDGKEHHNVVSKATNCRPGQIVAYAPVGSFIESHGDVGQETIQGVVSRGFLCSEKELGLSQWHEGIMEIDECAPGTDLASRFKDIAFDITITPNLGHCLSIVGIARELSAFTGMPLKKKPWLDSEPFQEIPVQHLVTVEQNDLCPRYAALLVDAVAVKPSSSAIRIRLERSGIRSINNVVDATNYVSLELGQPLHAFDAACVSGGHLTVRTSKPAETLLFLDEVERVLPDSSIVIADDAEALALAGVMGGASSAVSTKTEKIIFESASFLPTAIRKASKKLGVQTDSSRRFERGVDQNITMQALALALSLLPGARVVAKATVGSQKPYRTIECRLSRTSAILGYTVSVNEMESAFTKLFFLPSWDGVDTFTVQVPTFRHDVVAEIDLIEEVGRFVGLLGPSNHKPVYAASTLAHHPLYAFTNEIRNRLLCEALQEVLCCNLISPKMASSVIGHPITEESLVRVCNPLSSEQSIMRPSLLPGLLDSLARNQAQRKFDFAAFEIGHVHLKKQKMEHAQDFYDEPLCFALLMAGKVSPHHFAQEDREVDFYDLKGVLENLFIALDFEEVEFTESALTIMHPGRQAKICVQGAQIGVIGELHPALLASFDITGRAYFVECDMHELFKCARKERKMNALPLFPSSERDWTVTLPKSIRFDAIVAKIEASRPQILENVSLKAVFEHEKLGKEVHNITIHFVYRDRKKTISQQEVDLAHNALVAHVAESFVGV